MPGVELADTHGAPALKVNGKVLANLCREPGALSVFCPLELKEMLIASEPRFFFETDHFKGWPAVLVRMDAIDDDALRSRLVAAWELRAPKKLVKSWRAEKEGRT